MSVLPDDDRERLVKLLGLLGSAYAGERDAAACAASRSCASVSSPGRT
jgi:hypothetical protein